MKRRCRIHIDAVSRIPVIPAPGLGDILVCAREIPLAATWTGIITNCGRGEQPVHGQDASAHVVDADIAACADLLKLPLVGAKGFRRTS